MGTGGGRRGTPERMFAVRRGGVGTEARRLGGRLAGGWRWLAVPARRRRASPYCRSAASTSGNTDRTPRSSSAAASGVTSRGTSRHAARGAAVTAGQHINQLTRIRASRPARRGRLPTGSVTSRCTLPPLRRRRRRRRSNHRPTARRRSARRPPYRPPARRRPFLRRDARRDAPRRRPRHHLLRVGPRAKTAPKSWCGCGRCARRQPCAVSAATKRPISRGTEPRGVWVFVGSDPEAVQAVERAEGRV